MLQMPKVGDRMFDKAIGNAARGLKEPEITEVEVVKVGRKYFSCTELAYVGKPHSRYHETVYYIDRDVYREKTDYSPNHALYPSRQAIEDELEAGKLWNDLRDVFGGYGRPSLSLQALREISEIVKRDKETPSDV